MEPFCSEAYGTQQWKLLDCSADGVVCSSGHPKVATVVSMGLLIETTSLLLWCGQATAASFGFASSPHSTTIISYHHHSRQSNTRVGPASGADHPTHGAVQKLPLLRAPFCSEAYGTQQWKLLDCSADGVVCSSGHANLRVSLHRVVVVRNYGCALQAAGRPKGGNSGVDGGAHRDNLAPSLVRPGHRRLLWVRQQPTEHHHNFVPPPFNTRVGTASGVDHPTREAVQKLPLLHVVGLAAEWFHPHCQARYDEGTTAGDLAASQKGDFRCKAQNIQQWYQSLGLTISKMTSRVGASELAKTEKLNGTNFHSWKRRIMLALTLEKLIYVINQPFPTLGDKPTNEEIKAYESFVSDDLMAKTTMLAFMEDDQIRVFEDCPTAKEMFDSITSKYNTMTTMHVQLLQEQYNSYRMKESDD
ncbi:hypothetical protein EJ110_NYTH55374, partial [Nymphaea thermarum]